MKRKERQQQEQTKAIAQAVSIAVMDAIPEAMRAHRKINLDQPMTLELRPVIELRDNAVRHGLKELLDKRYFDISLFRSLCEAAHVYEPTGLMEILQPLHCLNWSKMEPDFRTQIQHQIVACFVPVESQTEEEGAA